MTRAQSRLNARYARDPSQANQDAVVGHALQKYHAARITPIHAAVRDHGMFATARQACKAGISLIDLYCGYFGCMVPELTDDIERKFVAIFGVMPKGSRK